MSWDEKHQLKSEVVVKLHCGLLCEMEFQRGQRRNKTAHRFRCSECQNDCLRKLDKLSYLRRDLMFHLIQREPGERK